MHIKHKLINFDWIPHNLIVPTISHKILWHNPFFPYKICFQPLPPPRPPVPPIQCRESVKIVWNCSDGCLIHLARLKPKKTTLKLGKEGLCHNFCGWLSESQKLFLQEFTLADAFKTFLNKLTNKFHTLHTASTRFPNLERDVIFWFYILTLGYIA